ncbi:hypothetical protein VTN96DRAFT_1156 [Rasamsonia emersonii]
MHDAIGSGAASSRSRDRGNGRSQLDQEEISLQPGRPLRGGAALSKNPGMGTVFRFANDGWSQHSMTMALILPTSPAIVRVKAA